MGIFDFIKKENGSPAMQSSAIEFAADGKVIRVDLPGGKRVENRSGQDCYLTQRGRSLLQAAEILKRVTSIPGQTYYLVETTDGNLGRDFFGFYAEAPLRPSG